MTISKTNKKSTSKKAASKKAASKKTTAKKTAAKKAAKSTATHDLQNNPAGLRRLAEKVVNEVRQLGAEVGKQIVVDTITKMLANALGVPSA